MKICFLTSSLAEIGGQQKIVSILANELAKIDEVDVSIVLINTDKVLYNLHPDINLLYDKSLKRKKNDYIFHKMLTKIFVKRNLVQNKNLLIKMLFPKNEIKNYQNFFMKYNFDVIIGVSPRESGILSLLNLNSKKIGWMHNTVERYFLIENEWLWGELNAYRQLLPKLDEVIVLTDHDKKIYEDTFEIRATRIYNPLTFKSIEKSPLTNNSILFVGRIYYLTKGIDLLLKSMKIITQSGSRIELNIVGNGPDMERLVQDLKNHKLEHSVNVLGSTDDVKSHYLQNSMLVLPSTIEGFGLVVTEALEMGLPVVSYKTEGPSEIITDKTDGFLIEKFDYQKFTEKVMLIMNDYTLRKTMGSNASDKAKKFSVNKIVEEWLILLK